MTTINLDDPLAIWQSNNCSRCKFADPEKVGTGEPCCTRPSGPEPMGGICLARVEPKKQEKGEGGRR